MTATVVDVAGDAATKMLINSLTARRVRRRPFSDGCAMEPDRPSRASSSVNGLARRHGSRSQRAPRRDFERVFRAHGERLRLFCSPLGRWRRAAGTPFAATFLQACGGIGKRVHLTQRSAGRWLPSPSRSTRATDYATAGHSTLQADRGTSRRPSVRQLRRRSRSASTTSGAMQTMLKAVQRLRVEDQRPGAGRLRRSSGTRTRRRPSRSPSARSRSRLSRTRQRLADPWRRTARPSRRM